MAKQYYEYWDEDNYPVRDDQMLEYVEDWEEEDDEWEHQYSPVQGRWDPRDFEEDSFQPINRRSKSIKMNEEIRQRNKKQEKARRYKQAKAEEKERKKYYHYDSEE